MQSISDNYYFCFLLVPDPWEVANDLPEHSLKIYKADQHFRYLLVHQNTSAREVAMLALQEFGISECSSNFTLCEVTVEVRNDVQPHRHGRYRINKNISTRAHGTPPTEFGFNLSLFGPPSETL